MVPPCMATTPTHHGFALSYVLNSTISMRTRPKKGNEMLHGRPEEEEHPPEDHRGQPSYAKWQERPNPKRHEQTHPQRKPLGARTQLAGSELHTASIRTKHEKARTQRRRHPHDAKDGKKDASLKTQIEPEDFCTKKLKGEKSESSLETSRPK